MSADRTGNAEETGAPVVKEVRYRLSDLLADIKTERSAGLFAQERFSQHEIEKIFKARKARHGKRVK
jgi:hypothetical protein